MKASTIKNFFSATLLITALFMSAFSCAGVADYEDHDQYQLFVVQTENTYLLDENSNATSNKCNSAKQKPRKEVSWTEWLTSGSQADLHFLNLLELIGG